MKSSFVVYVVVETGDTGLQTWLYVFSTRAEANYRRLSLTNTLQKRTKVRRATLTLFDT